MFFKIIEKFNDFNNYLLINFHICHYNKCYVGNILIKLCRIKLNYLVMVAIFETLICFYSY